MQLKPASHDCFLITQHFFYLQDGNKYWVFWFVAEHLEPEWKPLHELFLIRYY